MSIEFENVDGVLNAIGELADTAELETSLKKACSLVERSAKQKAPKDTGALIRSISSRIEGTQGIVFTPLEYAPYVEFGTGLFAEGGNGRQDVPWWYQDDKGEWHKTSGQQPQPFMRPALEENREEIMRILMEGLKHND